MGGAATTGDAAKDEPASSARLDAAWTVLAQLLDPEVPVLSLVDLGIVRGVRLVAWPDQAMADLPPHLAPQAAPRTALEVLLTPTYSGCPATEVISQSVVDALDGAGLGPTRVLMQLAPAWTTDWISAEGRRKLRDYGIAPPQPSSPAAGAAVPIRLVPRGQVAAVACPRCHSARTERLSAFGATACKALYRCLACREPFEHFKPI